MISVLVVDVLKRGIDDVIVLVSVALHEQQAERSDDGEGDDGDPAVLERV